MQFDVTITEELLRRVSLHRILRRWPVFIGLSLFVACYGIFYRPHGETELAAWIGLYSLLFLLVVFVSVHLRDRRMIAEWKRQQGAEPVRYQLTEDTIKAASNLGSTEVRWSVFRDLHEHPDYFLLGMGQTGHLTLPRRDVPDEAEAFIRRQFAALGLPTKKA